MSDFDVIAAFKVALGESTDPDPASVARAVAAEVPARARVEALTQALVRLAPTIAGAQRRQAMSVASSPGRDRWSDAGAIYRSHMLDQRISLANGWKLMRDCTADDMREAAEIRRSHARAVLSQAKLFDEIAALLVERGARTVGDLDRDDLDGLEAA